MELAFVQYGFPEGFFFFLASFIPCFVSIISRCFCSFSLENILGDQIISLFEEIVWKDRGGRWLLKTALI